MKQVVILGGGTAGLQVAVALSKRLPASLITLVDKQEYHQSSFGYVQPFMVSRTQDVPSGSVPDGHIAFTKIARRYGFAYIRGEVQRLSLRERYMQLHNRRLAYDYAILAQGSMAMPPSEFAFPVHTRAEVLRARKAIEFAFQKYRHNTISRPIRIVVVGGSVLGVSLVASVIPFIDILAKQYQIPRMRVELACFEQSSRVLPDYAYAAGRQVERVVFGLGAQVFCGQRVVRVEQHFIETEEGARHAADVVLWAGDWCARGLAVVDGALPFGTRNRILVDGKFQLQSYPNIFCVGDQASAPFPHRRGLPHEVIEEAEYVASILPLVMRNQLTPAYVQKDYVELLPFGTRSALRVTHARARVGLLPYVTLRRAMQKYQKTLS